MTKLDWVTFEPKFGTWAPKIKPFFDKGGFDPIFSYLKDQSREGKKIAPDSKLTFRCFIETPINELKCVMMGMCPYHTEVNGVLQADGLLMGCSNTGKIAPSLDIFFKGLENEMRSGVCLECLPTPDVTYLSKQGVLMFNAALTTEVGKAGKHQEIWEPFIAYMMEEIIGPSMVPVIFLGREAEKMQKYLAPTQWSFVVYHPAYAARTGEDWDTKGVFTKVNRILHDANNEVIEWLNIKWHELD